MAGVLHYEMELTLTISPYCVDCEHIGTTERLLAHTTLGSTWDDRPDPSRLQQHDPRRGL